MQELRRIMGRTKPPRKVKTTDTILAIAVLGGIAAGMAGTTIGIYGETMIREWGFGQAPIALAVSTGVAMVVFGVLLAAVAWGCLRHCAKHINYD